MVSYEKIRQALRSATFGLAIWYIVVLILSGITLGFATYTYSIISKEPEMQVLARTLLSNLLLTASSFAVVLLLVVLLFKNVKQLDDKQAPSPYAYYLGVAYTIIPQVINLIIYGIPKDQNLGLLAVSYGISILVLAVYIYILVKLSTYQHKDDDKVN